VTISEVRYLSRAEAAEFLSERGYKTAPATLAKRAVVGGGPPFVSWGRKPLYDPESLLEWAQRRCTGPRRSTSDRGEKRQSADCLDDSYHKLIERQPAAGATTNNRENRNPAPQPIDDRCDETEIANSRDLERPIEEISVGMSPGHQKTGYPYPRSAGKGAPIDSERHRARNKFDKKSSARRNANEGAA
jgi:hypothetical protein